MRSSHIDRRALLQFSLAVGALLPSCKVFAGTPATFPPPDQEFMVPVSSGRVYVRVNGRLDSPRLPVVLIHGGPGGNHAAFLNLLALRDERSVILYDQLDCGLSDHPGKPENWTVARFTSEVDAVRRALHIPRWHVLGQSWGGTIALEYGARRPPELAGLVLASPLVSTRSWIADANTLRARLPAAVQATLRGCEPPAPITHACRQATNIFYANYLGRTPTPKAYRDYVAAHRRLGFNEQLYEAMWGSSEFVATGTLRGYDGEPLLANLDGKRTLFIDGQYDEARPPTLAAFAALAHGADFGVVPGSAHAMFFDRPDEALGIIRPWFREHDGA